MEDENLEEYIHQYKKSLITERELKGLQFLKEANYFLDKIRKTKMKNFE